MPNAQQIKPFRNILKVKLKLLRTIPEMLGMSAYQLPLQCVQIEFNFTF